jgi:hypothetical protein
MVDIAGCGRDRGAGDIEWWAMRRAWPQSRSPGTRLAMVLVILTMAGGSFLVGGRAGFARRRRSPAASSRAPAGCLAA